MMPDGRLPLAPPPINEALFTPAEESFCKKICAKDTALREFLASHRLGAPVNSQQWLAYLTGIKSALGNLNNDLGFIATLLVKGYLKRRFSVVDFDAGAKAQGASGIDIEAKTADGKIIVGELKNHKALSTWLRRGAASFDIEGSLKARKNGC